MLISYINIEPQRSDHFFTYQEFLFESTLLNSSLLRQTRDVAAY